ncbi:MAG: T9SS type A sorting domain-containing protein [candidate division Zixibacteria bacterium]|nr:T9SS type A sorting domain-containing protein [candidate division Zixibacteria bacterium]
MQYPTEIALIRYHVWWPSSDDPFYQFNPQESAARNNYYGNNYAPHLFIDGEDADGSNYQELWEAMFMERYGVESDFMIIVDGDFYPSSRDANLNIDVFLTNINPAGDEYLRIALVEDSLYWLAPNGTEWHHQTFRDMIPDADGILMDMEDYGVFETSTDFNISDEIAEENCWLVVFVQSTIDREILQGYKIHLSDFSIVTSVDEDETAQPDEFKLLGNYPNPFNSSTKISFVLPRKGEVTLEVYNLIGQTIFNSSAQFSTSGKHSIKLDSNNFPSGLYYYRLSFGETTQIGRMTLVK